MAGDWREVPIGELAEIFDGPHATPSKTSDGPIFLGISSLVQGRIDLANSERLSEEDYRRRTRRVEPQEGDVVFSYETRLGEAAIIPNGLRCCLGRRMGLLRARPGTVDRGFLLYAYLGPQFQETIRSRTIHGSTVDRIPLSEMPSFPIRVPTSIAEQRAIAHILGTLDDKIELNRRVNETLEAMARALFKSWFVDFDPVRAKAEGRGPGLPQPLADLFPDSFEDSELGEVPSGWRVECIGGLADVVGGTTPSTKNSAYWDGGEHAWATPKDLSALSVPVLLNTERRIGDTTEFVIGTSSKLYLAVVLDLFSRFVVGWAVSAVNDRHVTIKALEMALKRRGPRRGLLHHSDQGCTYASQDYQARLTAAGIVCSMSRRGNCYDNAVMESFFSTVKSELGDQFASNGDAKMDLFDFIEVFYNQRRRHSTLGQISPAAFERQAASQAA